MRWTPVITGVSGRFAIGSAELAPDVTDRGGIIGTTMGFSALDGLVMGTRSGALDPGVIIYLQEVSGLTPKDVEDLLYHQSGLLGVSGLSSDARVLLASEAPRARQAIDLFTFSIARHVAMMANSLGGLECLVFTGGIGEHMPEIRAMTCDRLAWLGARLDPSANRRGGGQISHEASSVAILVIPADEELVIARHAASLLAA